MESPAKTVVWTVGAQLAALGFSLLVVFLIVWAASKAWKRGQESSYCVDGNKDCFQY